MCKYCIGNIEGESCGWPKGTVRGAIALITIPLAFVIASAAIIILILKNEYDVALGILSGQMGAVGGIIGYYFGSKNGENTANLLSQAGHELIESRNREIDHNNMISRSMLRHNHIHNHQNNQNNNNDSAVYMEDL